MVDRRLRSIAKQRGALDAEEARWLREAERLQIWRRFGMVSALDYMERVLGYTPHAARERLRVATALAALPAIANAFARGELPFSAVRELTRVATAETDAAWRDATVGKSVREIEDAVAGRTRGSLPTDPPDPTARTHVVRLELRADTYARLRQTGVVLAEDAGHHLDDNELVDTLCEAALERRASKEPTGRAKFQVSMTVCERCRKGWQHGGGAKLPVDDAAVDRALCDAQHVGSIDGDQPDRAYQDIPPATVRFVWHRDGGRCQTPGCRSALGLELHHIVRRVDGGTHEASNLTLRCGACHRAHHEGKLAIRGTAPDRLVTQRCAPPDHGARSAASSDAVVVAESHDASTAGRSSKLDRTIVRTQARDALVTMGWRSGIARDAVEAAASHVGPDASLEALVREALRRCPLSASAMTLVG